MNKCWFAVGRRRKENAERRKGKRKRMLLEKGERGRRERESR